MSKQVINPYSNISSADLIISYKIIHEFNEIEDIKKEILIEMKDKKGNILAQVTGKLSEYAFILHSKKG